MRVKYFIATFIVGLFFLTTNNIYYTYAHEYKPDCSTPNAFNLTGPADGATFHCTDTVTLSWQNNGNVSGWYIYFGTDSNPSYYKTVYTPSWTFTYNLQSGNTYYWKIQAYHSGDCNPTYRWNNGGTRSFNVIPPNPPTGLTIKAVSPDQIDLQWNDTSYETGYWLSRGTESGSYTHDVHLGADVNSYSDTYYLQSCHTYYYAVLASSNCGDSLYSDEVSAEVGKWIPNVVNMTQEDASTTIVTAGFTVGTITQEYDNAVSEGNIISQDPPADTHALCESPVDLVVSLGKPVVPYVIGMTELAAGAAITAVDNLAVGTVTQEHSDLMAAGLVKYQSPAGFTPVDIGSIIDLVISLGPETPTAPSDLTVSAVSGYPSRLDLTWMDNSDTEDGFKIQRKLSGEDWADAITITVGHITGYSDIGLNSSMTYDYRVCAYNAGGDSGWSEASQSPCPSNPSGLSAASGDGSVTLNWSTDTAEYDVTGYNVYRSTTSGSGYSQINGTLVLKSGPQYVDDDVINGTTYYYIIRAIDTLGNVSGNSNEVSATPQDLPPAAPQNLTAVFNTTTGKVNLNWNPNNESDLGGYKVYRSFTAGDNYIEIATTGVLESEYDDNVAASGVENRTYYYVVTAFDNPGNESVYSDQVSTSVAYRVHNLNRNKWYYLIQPAINDAMNNETIEVSQSTYVENIQFTDKQIILTSTDTSDPASTVIESPSPMGNVVTFDSGDAASEIIGFTITNGHGGIYCDGASPTVENCVIYNNNQGTGGIYLSNGTITVIETIIEHNQYGDSRGVYLYHGSLILRDSTISSNYVHGRGGGIYGDEGAEIDIENSFITGNISSQGGSAIYGCSGSIRNTVINNQYSETGPSGIEYSSVNIFNSIIMNNFSDGYPAIIEHCTGNFQNCTIANNNNIALSYCDGSINSCILYNNGISSGPQLTNSSVPVYSCIKNWSGGSEYHNITSDPLLNANGYLTSGSPCIDAGDPTYLPADGETDIVGNRRLRATAVDMGAHEYGDIIYVDADVAESGNGESWDTAYKYLQDAFDSSPEPGDEIWVAEGTYYPNEDTDGGHTAGRAETFQLAEKVALYGGFGGIGTNETSLDQRRLVNHQTILSGDIDKNDNGLPHSGNSYHVVTGTNKSKIDGFVISGGYADGTGAYQSGGGIYNNDAALIAHNCNFSCNYAASQGGGVFNSGSSTPVLVVLVNCLFSGNATADVSGCKGGAIYNNGDIKLTNCTISNNIAYSTGGIYNGSTGNSTLRNCILWDNRDTAHVSTTPCLAQQIYDAGTASTVTYSCIQDDQQGDGTIPFDPAATNHNIDSDPKFVSPGHWDGVALPDSRLLQATVRDLHSYHTIHSDYLWNNNLNPSGTHIDFQNQANETTPFHWGSQIVTGIVGDIGSGLDNEGKPNYALGDDDPGDCITHGKQYFNQWFRDVDGVNLRNDIILECMATGTPGEYEYNDAEFFPIDHWGFGHEITNKQDHNYSFTMELHAKFNIDPSWTGSTHYFKAHEADDDMWIYIDGKLILDMGGLHPSRYRKLEIADTDSDELFEVRIYTPEDDTKSYPTTEPSSFTTVTYDLNLTSGNHTFDLFYAERHSDASHLHFSTTVPLQSNFTSGDYHLQPTSPCIDAGDNDAVPNNVKIDLDGVPRFIDDPDTVDTGVPTGDAPYVDMGAYEYNPYPYEPIQVDAGVDKQTILPDDKEKLWDATVTGGYPDLTKVEWTVEHKPFGCQVDFNPQTVAVEQTSNELNPEVRFIVDENVFKNQDYAAFVLKLSAADGFSGDSNTVAVFVYPGGTQNKPPYVNAGGPYPTVKVGQELILDEAEVYDDGLPSGYLKHKWEVILFPTDPVGSWKFNPEYDEDTVQARITFNQPTTPDRPYRLMLWAEDKVEERVTSYTDIQVIEDGPANIPPTVEAGDGHVNDADTFDESITLNGVTLPYVLDLGTDLITPPSATDDGLLRPLSCLWTIPITTRPGGAVFISGKQSPLSTVRFTESGTYRLMLTADDGQYEPYDTLTVVINPAPTFDAGLDRFREVSTPSLVIDMNDAWARDNTLPEGLSYLWEVDAAQKPTGATVVFENEGTTSTQLNPTVLITAANVEDMEGLYRLILTVTDNSSGLPPVSDDVFVLVLSKPVPPDPSTKKIFAGTSKSVASSGGQVFCRIFPNDTEWVAISEPGDLDDAVLCLCEYNNDIYAGTRDSAEGNVYKYVGNKEWVKMSNWSDVGGASYEVSSVYSMAVYDGKLFVGTDVPNKLFKYESNLWTAIDITGYTSGVRSLYVWKNKLFLDANHAGKVRFYDSALGWVEVESP
jgi:fibro-slime domain-containing protein